MKKLKRILNDATEVSITTYEGLHATIIVNQKASEEDINEANTYFSHTIPADYLSFLRDFNGCTLFKVEDIGGFEFLSCRRLIQVNRFEKENLEEYWKDNIIFFCSCLGDGDFIGFKTINENVYELLDCYHEELPAKWKTIGNSFDVFFDKLIDSKGERFWLNAD